MFGFSHSLVRVIFITLVGMGLLHVPEGNCYQDLERQSYRDIRYLGRGDTGASSTSDGAALFYNPAALAEGMGLSVKVSNPTIGTNQAVYDSAKNGFQLKDSKSLTEKFSPYLGKQLGVISSIFPNVTIPFFSVGYFYYGRGDMTYRNPVNPEFVVRARYDHGVIFGGAIPFSRHFSLGTAVKYFKRTQIFNDITGGDLLISSNTAISNYLQTGRAWGVNAGALGHIPISELTRVNLGLSVEDLGDTKIRNPSAPRSEPPSQKMIMSGGANWEYDSSNLGLKALFDIKHLNRSDYSYTKKIHMGVEVSFLRTDIRAGFNQGYYTAGLSVRIIPLIYFDAVTYGEELDSAAGLRENRVYLLGVSMGLDLGKSPGKKQRLNLDNIK